MKAKSRTAPQRPSETTVVIKLFPSVAAQCGSCTAPGAEHT